MDALFLAALKTQPPGIEHLMPLPDGRPVKLTYRSLVTEQAYKDGRPLFREEAIGRPGESKTLYTHNPRVAAELLSRWQQHPWRYDILAAETIRQIPRDKPYWFTAHDRVDPEA